MKVLESRLEAWHVRFSGRHNWRLSITFVSLLGFGITYLPDTDYWDNELEKRVWVPVDQVQSKLNTVLKYARFTKTLEVRTLQPFDYSHVKTLSRLKALSIVGPLQHTLDLSGNSTLNTIGCLDKTCNKIIGLDRLPNLHFVHCFNPSAQFLMTLPRSVTGLFTRGKFDVEKTLNRLPKLEYLSIGSVKELSFSDFSGVFPELSELTFVRLRNLEGVEQFPILFPNLKTLTLVDFKSDSIPQIESALASSKIKLEIFS